MEIDPGRWKPPEPVVRRRQRGADRWGANSGAGEPVWRRFGRISSAPREAGEGKGKKKTLTGGSRCEPDEERDKGCRVDRGQKRKLPQREGEEKGNLPDRVSFLFFF